MVDGNNSIIVTGTFTGTVDFDPGAGTHDISSGGSNTDIFVMKLSGNGNFVWAGGLSGNGGFDRVYVLEVNANNDVFIAGNFGGTIDMDPGAGTQTFNPIIGSLNDAFILKLNSAGVYQWAKNFGGASTDYIYTMKLDDSGNIIVGGEFRGSADLDAGSGTFMVNTGASNNSNGFIAKYSPSGSFLWGYPIGLTVSAGNGLETTRAVTVDSNGNVYASGQFSTLMDFDNSNGVANMQAQGGFANSYIMKLTPAGSFLWAKQITGFTYNDFMKFGSDGYLYSHGRVAQPSDFDAGNGTFNYTPVNATDDDTYVLKLNENEQFVYMRAFNESTFPFGFGNYGFDIRHLPTMYFTGALGGTVDFDPEASTANLTNAPGGMDCYIVKWNECYTTSSIQSFACGSYTTPSGNNTYTAISMT